MTSSSAFRTRSSWPKAHRQPIRIVFPAKLAMSTSTAQKKMILPASASFGLEASAQSRRPTIAAMKGTTATAMPLFPDERPTVGLLSGVPAWTSPQSQPASPA